MIFDLHHYFDPAVLFLRLSVAAVFIGHGMSKVLNPAEVVKDSGKPQLAGPFRVLGFLECAGALGVGLGLFTQLAGIWLAAMMLGALAINIVQLKANFTSHAPKSGGWDLPLALLAGVVAIVVWGPGRFSIDFFLHQN